eukprot:gi/632984184/ref/XP_007909014.1/ PREDICTED: tuberoinfundibular peptide of 39 residues [Callorhinchus milii]
MDVCQPGRGLMIVAVILLSSCTAPGSGSALPRLRQADSSVSRWWQSDVSPGLGIENVLQTSPIWDVSIPQDGNAEVILYLLQNRLPGNAHLLSLATAQLGGEGPGVRVSGRPEPGVGGDGGKRSVVVADDVAFRENSKFLTAMERQKWLNSIIRKLVVSRK